MDLKDIVRVENGKFNFSVDVKLLNRLAKRQDIAEAPYLNWYHIHMLAIVGVGKIPGLEQGCYVDRKNGEWMLMAGLKSSKISEYINQKCPHSMKYLAIAGTDVDELHFDIKPYLRELWLIDNPNLHYVSGVDNLTGLRVLKIQLEQLDSELNLSNMLDLEELDLRGTELSKIRLDRQLKHLKKCDLRYSQIDNMDFLGYCPVQECLLIPGNRPSPHSLEFVPKKQFNQACGVAPTEQKKESSSHDLTLNQAATDELIEEHQLLMTILKVCGQIQREPECWGTKEDVRNRRMRDALEIAQYNVFDQRQLGISGAKKDVGELDLMLYRGNQVPWSIIEALRIHDGSKGDWNTHLAKVLDNYNVHGVPFLFLVTYADCEKKRFDGIWKGYEHHIQNHHSGDFAYVDQSYELLTGLLNNHYLQIAKTRYRCGDYTPTVYHVFVQMNPKQEVTAE